jgi:hypothetical protein
MSIFSVGISFLPCAGGGNSIPEPAELGRRARF